MVKMGGWDTEGKLRRRRRRRVPDSEWKVRRRERGEGQVVMNVQLFPADCLQPSGGSDYGSVMMKLDRVASVTTWTLGRKTSTKE